MERSNKFIVKSVSVTKNRIDFDYEISGEWSKYFNKETKFFVEYTIDISQVPESIAIVPLLGNILPMAWLCDAEIIVPEVDSAFYNSIPEFKQGYIDMHKKMNFKGSLTAGKIVSNNYERQGVMALFSGGVDAFNTLVNHIDEKPVLITLQGSDVKLDDEKGWEIVSKHIKSVCEEFDLQSIAIKSNFRTFIKENVLDTLVKNSGDGWWHGFQHGVGLITHTAPVAFTMKKNALYIASSFTIAQKGISCASDPTIDNYIRFGSTKVVHDGYEFNRQMKIENISEYRWKSGHKIRLHVCWISRGGENCCCCEKCLRTIMGLYANGEDPRNYGFVYADFSELCKYLNNNRYILYTATFLENWSPIQNGMHKHYRLKDVDPNLRWFYKADLNHFNPYPFGLRLKNKLRRILAKLNS